MWKNHELVQYRTYEAQAGPLSLFLRLEGDEVLLAAEYNEKQKSLKTLAPLSGKKTYQDLAWMRYILDSNVSSISLLPMLPDKPVVVRPEYPIHVMQNRQISFFVNIPIWVRILPGTAMPKPIELPSVQLSKTWFGDTQVGEICYALKTRAMRSETESAHAPYLVTCPLQIQNNSSKVLDFDKICVHVENLSLYQEVPGRFWTNSVSISYREGDQRTQVNVSPEAPQYAAGCVKLSEPRDTGTSSLVRRSFHFFKNLTGL
ncbi:MAG: DUF432 domain-containing protein [Spirochaetales bacterium]|nr:MAG: DUF432 domain-containing protein [Spirochaetales bacterium]